METTTITIIRADGWEERHELKRSTLYKDISALLNATTLTFVRLTDGRTMVGDDHGYQVDPIEERKILPGLEALGAIPVITLNPVKALLPDNAKATALYHAVCKPGTTHRIVGDVAIIDKE